MSIKIDHYFIHKISELPSGSDFFSTPKRLLVPYAFNLKGHRGDFSLEYITSIRLGEGPLQADGLVNNMFQPGKGIPS